MVGGVDRLRSWDRDALGALRGAVYRRDGGAVLAALEGRDLDDVLQLAGDGLLAAVEQGVAGAEALARSCAERLRRRGLDGDAELADALAGAGAELRPLAIDLDELSAILEGDPLRGGGRVDLRTGEVWHHSPFDDLVDVDEDELDDPERWLWVEATSRDGWWDMSEFTETVADAALADRLQRAIQDRGAFRRFRDELDEHPDELTSFHRFSDERQRSRARRWLAEHGLRSAS